MGTSFTEFRGHGFWSRDAALELWLDLMAREVEALADPPEWLRKARNDWYLHATAGWNSGWVSACLDEHLPSQDRIEVVLELAERVLARLRGQGSVLSADWLNSRGLGGPGSYFERDVPTDAFIPVGEAFIRLLRGEVSWNATTSPVV
jgi:hypothetical protein